MNASPPIALDEHDGKRLLARYGVPVVAEERVEGVEAALQAARRLGWPVAIKGCGPAYAHKTELGLVRLDVRDPDALRHEATRLLGAMQGCGALLVQRMVSGRRELLVGMTRDDQFGPVVTFGLGGIFAEVLADVSLRLCPLDEHDALEMLGELRGTAMLDAVRGLPPVDRGALVRTLLGLSRLAIERPDVESVDINPLVVDGAQPVAVDALVILR